MLFDEIKALPLEAFKEQQHIQTKLVKSRKKCYCNLHSSMSEIDPIAR